MGRRSTLQGSQSICRAGQCTDCQVCVSSSQVRLSNCVGMRVSTSLRQAQGSRPCSFADCTRLIAIAPRRPAHSLPADSQALHPLGQGRTGCLMLWLSMLTLAERARQGGLNLIGQAVSQACEELLGLADSGRERAESAALRVVVHDVRQVLLARGNERQRAGRAGVAEAAVREARSRAGLDLDDAALDEPRLPRFTIRLGTHRPPALVGQRLARLVDRHAVDVRHLNVSEEPADFTTRNGQPFG